MKRVARSLVALAALFSTLGVAGCTSDAAEESGASGAAQSIDRPPQFVLLAFDGSLNLNFWEESRKFARDFRAETRAAGEERELDFTYFISGVYFIPDTNKSTYDAPKNGRGRSAIGWGGDETSIRARYAQLQAAHDEKHEIASHANGHFDGTSWSQADWKSEFDQFDKIIFEGAGVAPNLGFGPLDSVGFRAPQLGHKTEMLYPVMAAHNYAYDTSKSGAANYWPQQISGVWNFPLAQLRIVGSGKKTLSMDYNFYVADSAGAPKPENREIYRKQMLDTYMAYFESNYFGNRAPLHIGHHFSKWNGGAYWAAMKEFATRVCKLPEVRCGTYKELLAFVEENKNNLSAFQRHTSAAPTFTPMPRTPSAEAAAAVAPFSEEEVAEVMRGEQEHHDHEGDDE